MHGRMDKLTEVGESEITDPVEEDSDVERGRSRLDPSPPTTTRPVTASLKLDRASCLRPESCLGRELCSFPSHLCARRNPAVVPGGVVEQRLVSLRFTSDPWRR